MRNSVKVLLLACTALVSFNASAAVNAAIVDPIGDRGGNVRIAMRNAIIDATHAALNATTAGTFGGGHPLVDLPADLPAKAATVVTVLDTALRGAGGAAVAAVVDRDAAVVTLGAIPTVAGAADGTADTSARTAVAYIGGACTALDRAIAAVPGGAAVAPALDLNARIIALVAAGAAAVQNAAGAAGAELDATNDALDVVYAAPIAPIAGVAGDTNDNAHVKAANVVAALDVARQAATTANATIDAANAALDDAGIPADAVAAAAAVVRAPLALSDRITTLAARRDAANAERDALAGLRDAANAAIDAANTSLATILAAVQPVGFVNGLMGMAANLAGALGIVPHPTPLQLLQQRIEQLSAHLVPAAQQPVADGNAGNAGNEDAGDAGNAGNEDAGDAGNAGNEDAGNAGNEDAGDAGNAGNEDAGDAGDAQVQPQA